MAKPEWEKKLYKHRKSGKELFTRGRIPLSISVCGFTLLSH